MQYCRGSWEPQRRSWLQDLFHETPSANLSSAFESHGKIDGAKISVVSCVVSWSDGLNFVQMVNCSCRRYTFPQKSTKETWTFLQRQRKHSISYTAISQALYFETRRFLCLFIITSNQHHLFHIQFLEDTTGCYYINGYEVIYCSHVVLPFYHLTNNLLRNNEDSCRSRPCRRKNLLPFEPWQGLPHRVRISSCSHQFAPNNVKGDTKKISIYLQFMVKYLYLRCFLIPVPTPTEYYQQHPLRLVWRNTQVAWQGEP